MPVFVVLVAALPGAARAAGGGRTPRWGARVTGIAGFESIDLAPDCCASPITLRPLTLGVRGVVERTFDRPFPWRLVLEVEITDTVVFGGYNVPFDGPAPGSALLTLVGGDWRWVHLRLGLFATNNGLGGPGYPGSGAYGPGYMQPLGPVAWRLRLGPFGPISIVLGQFDHVVPTRFAGARLGIRVHVQDVTIGLDGTDDNWVFYATQWSPLDPYGLDGFGTSGFAALQLTPGVSVMVLARYQPTPANTSIWAVAAGVRVAFGPDRASVSLLPQ